MRAHQSVLLALAALTLAACADRPHVAETPPPPPPVTLDLTLTRWVLSDTPPSSVSPTLEFPEGGRAVGFAGCNQWFAQIDTSNGLSFSAIGMTRRACPEPAMTLEREFAAKLAATRNATRDGDTLTLLGEDGTALAHFTRTR